MPHFDDYVYMYRDLTDADVFSDHTAYGVITNFMANMISSLITRIDDKLIGPIAVDLSNNVHMQALLVYGLFFQFGFMLNQTARNIIQTTPQCVRVFATYILPCIFATTSLMFALIEEEEKKEKIELCQQLRKRLQTSIFMSKYSETSDLKRTNHNENGLSFIWAIARIPSCTLYAMGFKGIGQSYIQGAWLEPNGKSYIRKTNSII